MNKKINFLEWKSLISNIEEVIKKMNETRILSVGVAPYTRIIPSLFLDNYSIYSVKRSSDVDLLEKYFDIYTLEDKNPGLASRVHGTGFLVKSEAFQRFYTSQPKGTHLMFYTMTEGLVDDLNHLNIPFIGNSPYLCNDVKYKSNFRNLLKDLGIKTAKSTIYKKEIFFGKSFSELFSEFNGSFVIQRGDKETGGNEGTFFIHDESDFSSCISGLNKSGDFEELVVTEFIEGYSTSMLGCITKKGVLSGPLQLQFVDVPESLQGVPKNGIFFGNDLEFTNWSPDTEEDAKRVIELVGGHLEKLGYKGVFGVDFLYDKNKKEIFAIECNPRFTGSLLLHSLSMIHKKIPPLEFFHLASHLDIDVEFDFVEVNRNLKQHSGFSHVSFSPKEITALRLPIVAGIYNYMKEIDSLMYKGPGITLKDLKDKNDFLIVDTVPQINKPIEKNVPRLFKFIFPYSIAKSSHEIEERAAFLVDRFAKTIIQADKNK